MDNEFVILLARGEYMARPQAGDRVPHATPDAHEAQRFPSRMAALGACSRGPASFFDHATILAAPGMPQDAPAALQGPQPSPEGQDAQGEAPALEDGGE